MCYWYNELGVPRITIGPTWQFAIPVFAGVLVMLYCFLNGLYNMKLMPIQYKLIAIVMIIIDFALYLYTLFAN